MKQNLFKTYAYKKMKGESEIADFYADQSFMNYNNIEFVVVLHKKKIELTAMVGKKSSYIGDLLSRGFMVG